MTAVEDGEILYSNDFQDSLEQCIHNPDKVVFQRYNSVVRDHQKNEKKDNLAKVETNVQLQA